ncbi:uncharacterized protein N0V89_002945 [Didymosphaeria variabile]|uniref:CFEM domain-containing protein n=1 Tax=Didymosphaeria variabile TaxID=1932322 RepID=A0A9W8XUF1_9PLEO|nr:uncharacterized protein N0V89_002945 [Didymosphaeria variabile]KAJ4358363.1 hypothetical protein N0V89_002945 [Didymosphaeria variabile]
MPGCATKCLQDSLKAQDKCTATDVACICADESLNAAIQGCVLQSCTVIDALAAQNATQAMCGAPVRDITHITPIITGTSGAAAIIGVAVRVWMSGPDFWLDDAMCVAALVFAIPMAVLEFLMSGLGFGKDIWTLTPGQIYRIVQYTWLTEIFWFVAIGCTKLAFLFLYLRVFPRQKLRKAVQVLIGLGALSTLIFTVIVTVNCLPISYIWTSWDGLHNGKCINLNAFVWAHAIIDIVFDCIIFAIPIPELIKLKMSLKKRIMIVAMFSVGGIGTIVSILRLQSLLAFANSTNATWDNCPTAYWSVLACFVGIFCACMPALRKCLAFIFPSCFSSTQQNSNYKDYSGTPNARLSTNKVESKRSKSRSGLGSALQSFGGITKTVDTNFTVTRVEDDEQELVHMKTKSGARAPSHWSLGEGSDKSDSERQMRRPN